jgi:hypothetical protein
MSPSMRALVLLLGLASLPGCFNPHVESGGFSCDPSLSPSCPSGFHCVNNLCVDTTGGPTHETGDLSVLADGSTPIPPSPDLSLPATPGDLAVMPSPPDLASANSCAHSVCTTGAILQTGCSTCATAICAQDPYCCQTKWSSQCVAEVATYCGAADHCP